MRRSPSIPTRPNELPVAKSNRHQLIHRPTHTNMFKQAIFRTLITALTAGFPLSATAQTSATANLPPTVFPPYLQNPTADGMTVCFLAQGMDQVSVAWRMGAAADLAETTTGPTDSAAVSLPVPGTMWTMWRVRLSGLHGGAVVQYQVRYRSRFGGQSGVTPLARFRTLDPAAKTLRFVMFNDLHHQDKTLASLMQFVKPEDYEFSVLLGDCLEAHPNDAELFRAWRAYLELLNAGEKPVVFVRGNHDTRNSFASRLAYLFDLPNLNVAQPWGEDQWQFTLRAGPVWFLAMDTGEDEDGVNTDPRTAYKQPELWRASRRRQAVWLKDLVATKPGADAPWHIFLSHIPLYNNNPWDSPSSRDLWEPVLRDANLDLMLAAHDHQWKLLQKNPGGRPPWPVLIGGGPSLNEGTVMVAAADATTLRVRLLAASDGRQLTEFTASKPSSAKP